MEQQQQWIPAFEELAENVSKALLSDSHEYVHGVVRQLETHKQSIITLLEIPAPNVGHRAQLKLGSPKINGRVRTVNEDFISEAILLSDQLELDEYIASSLLDYGIERRARFDRTAIETAIILFHREKIAMLHIIHAILDTSSTYDAPTEFSRAIVNFRDDLLQSNLGSKALNLIENLEKKATALKNAMTETSTLVAQLGMPINEDRLDFIKQERVLVATIMFDIAFCHELPASTVKSTIITLKKMNLSDPLAIYLTVTVMAAFEVSPEHMRIRGKSSDDFPIYMAQETIFTDYASFITEKNWAVPAIGAVILLQFSLCIGNVYQNRGNGLSEDDLQRVTENAVTSDAFQFIANYILGFKSQVVINGNEIEVPFKMSNASLGILDQNTDGFETTVGKPVAVRMAVDVQDQILVLLEMTMRDFIITMQTLLRKIKHREEDVVAHQSSLRQSQMQLAHRNDLDALFTVVALLYKGRPEAGIRFWPNNDDRLYRFLKWGVDCKNTARSFFDMLGSLATGPQCAHYAYEFLKSNGGRYGTQGSATPNTLCSWGKLFEAVDYYTERLNAEISAGGQVEKILPEEEALLKSFLHLLSVVAQYSAVARSAMNDSKQYQVIHSLFRFFICPISVDLKASILDAIAAFATPSTNRSETINMIWDYLEQARILPKSYATPSPEQTLSAGDKGPVVATSPRQEQESLDTGIDYDIEEIEAANKTFPETLSFTRLLCNLIQVPLNPEELLSGGSPSISSQLGSSYRQPGVIPYVRFVLDKIFVKALNRTYRVTNEKWKVVDSCLCFMERCLLSFDIGSFVIGESLKKDQDDTSIEAQRKNVLRASLHPAFEVLTRLLSGGDVLHEIFRVIGTGVDILNKEDKTTPYLKSSILRCFRIVTKTMQLQDVFKEYIIQILLSSGSRNSVLSSLAPMEQHLAFSHASIVDIACYINCDVSLEICSLSIEILDRLSASPLFTSTVGHRSTAINRLVRLLQTSSLSNQILYGFAQKLEEEEDEQTDEFGVPHADPSMAIDGLESHNAVQKRAIFAPPPITASTVRLQIMRLLLDNLDESRSPPSIAHFLLGYPTEFRLAGSENVDILSNNLSITALNVTLDLLRRGVDGQDFDYTSLSSIPLYITHPQLAAKCQELIYRLCVEPETTKPTMRYLRTNEAFFYRQLKALPIRFEEGLEGPHGVFIRRDGSQFRANFFNLLSQLYQRSWVMRTAALELRVACETNQRSEAVRLLSLIFDNTDNARATNSDDFMFSISRARNGNLVQPRVKILELLDSFDFAWDDDLKIKDLERYYFPDISEDSCLEKDENGIELYNARKLFSLLVARKSQLENENIISGVAHKAAAHAEIEAIMGQCLAKNHARKLEAARRTAFESWRELIEITLGPGFYSLKVEKREMILYDILEAVLAKLQRDCPVDITTILSKVVLSILQRLRSDHFRQFIFQATSTDPNKMDTRLPAERLHRLARGIIASILRPGTSESRYNMYSALVNYFQYTRSEDDTLKSAKSSSLYASDVARSKVGSGARSAIELGNQVLVAEAGERLLEIVCRDASDVDQVCKIAAFTLLNTLYGLFEKETTNRVLVHLVQRNYLKHFIDIMAREDLELQACVKGRVSRMPILSEARMTLFLRIAQRRDGAEQLLEYGFFDVLTNSSAVIDIRSNLDSADFGPFEQTESNLYHNIVYPMLQVAVAILANLGRNHRTATSKAELFVTSHQDTFASILRDSDVPTTINSLRELRVITAFLNQLAGHIATKSASAASVFGPLHNLLLALIPKYFSADQWSQSLQPVSDAEKMMATTLAPALTARSGTSLFERDAKNFARDICKNLLSYCQISTENVNRTASKSFTPLFTWTISNLVSGHDSVAVPSLATLVGFMSRTTNDVQEALLRHQTQVIKLDNIASLTPEEKQDILQSSDEDYLDELVAIQRDQLAVQVLQKMLLSSTQEIMSDLYLLEISLTVFWRHLEYYLGQYGGLLDGTASQSRLGVSRFGHNSVFSGFESGAGTSAGGGSVGVSSLSFARNSGFGGFGTASSMATSNGSGDFGISLNTSQSVNQSLSKNFKPTLAEAQALKRDAGHMIKPVLDNIASLDLTQERMRWDSSSRNSFIELLVRNIRALVERT
ncbi:nucleoporin Nup186/Nup192/Nup205 [Lobosporangium transversale]|uniref:Nucleoporin Nup186/Nup192/Nup205 n=1 Tax=Lobosporangium transversale TaxID=64571 RepID=A0A1Y2GHR0_9FUNG|nr:nucleoporin Nup186/Nup192/Nup205 [Lobosporangium transversale]ORZ11308.1 nucleoporin Nup186/Nup192/Nup205 [Lobosporangium transversale]|eukprot:XP_021879623.1 nucleoporin Nup186/Nup192/Nup205 [Lobosporangium transversale]